jgi:pyruvate,water dikinase
MDFAVDEVAVADLPPSPVKMQINLANPELAFDFAKLPCDGVGLARLEFIIARAIGVHPRATLEYASLPADLQREVRARADGFSSPREFYVAKLAEGIAAIGAAFYPRPVIVRLSDFKTNEYAGMLGGRRFEPAEENPMLGFRGAGRYLDASFQAAFALECEAFLRAREGAGLSNLEAMIPFVRTPEEAEGVIHLLADNGMARGRGGLRILMMCELPANAILADEFLRHFDGFSIGSNDLTQTTLGLDRDSGLVAGAFDERNEAVRRLIAMAIAACKRADKYVGICGQGPSDYPDFAAWLVEEGVSAISLNPDTLIEARLALARAARK